MLFLKAMTEYGSVTYINLSQVKKMIYRPSEDETDVYFPDQTKPTTLLGNITDQTIVEFKGENDG